jgi:BolA protein
MDVAQIIEAKLRENLTIDHLTVLNQSDQHRGHGGSPGTGQSHFEAIVVSNDFEGVGKVQRQRKIYQILQAEMAGPIHALALTTLTPAEFKQRASS